MHLRVHLKEILLNVLAVGRDITTFNSAGTGKQALESEGLNSTVNNVMSMKNIGNSRG